VLKRPKIEYRK